MRVLYNERRCNHAVLKFYNFARNTKEFRAGN